MKVGKYDVPTPLLIGGIAGVGILVLGQRLTGDAPAPESAPGVAGTDGVPATAVGGGGGGDLWGDSEVGQFPSFVPTPGAPSVPAGGYGWWDDEAPPPAAGPINLPGDPAPVPTTPLSPVAPPPPPAPTPTPIAPIAPAPSPSPTSPTVTQWWPAYLGAPPLGAQGYVVVNGSFFWYGVSGGTIVSRTQTNAQFSAYVGKIAAYPWPGRGNYSLGNLLSGTHRGRWVAVYDAPVIRLVRKP